MTARLLKSWVGTLRLLRIEVQETPLRSAFFKGNQKGTFFRCEAITQLSDDLVADLQ